MNRQYQMGLLLMALGALLVLVVVESFLATPLSAVGADATHTVPAPPGDTATPSATLAARAFAPVVFEQGRSPTPFVTAPPPTVGPTHTPPPPPSP